MSVKTLFSWVNSHLGKEYSAKILILGLDFAGKTSLTKHLTKNANYSIGPTIGHNIEMIKFNKWNITLIDVTGQKKFRFLWSAHYPNLDGLIYVIDASDKKRLEENKKVFLEFIIQNPELNEIPILVFANKQDVIDSIPGNNLLTAMGFQIGKEHRIKAISSSIIKKQGINEGMDWLINRISGKNK
ncbi:MAG: ADP-ribosylation factor family protein [Candidatus Kariarchaeaceae archaeon]